MRVPFLLGKDVCLTSVPLVQADKIFVFLFYRSFYELGVGVKSVFLFPPWWCFFDDLGRGWTLARE